MKAMFLAAAFAVAVPVAGGGALLATHQQPDLAGSVVKLQITKGGHGSAIHIGGGVLVTAAHVVDGEDGLTIKTDKGEIIEDVEVLWANTTYDVALVRAKGDGIAAANLECRTPEVGEAITLQGNPMQMEFITTWGRVAGNPAAWGEYWANAVPVDAALGPGMSGGGVFDADGDLIGINVGMALAPIGMGGATAMGINLVVPGDTICELLARG